VDRPHVLIEEECRIEKAPHVINIQLTPELLQDAPISKDLTKEEMHLLPLHPYTPWRLASPLGELKNLVESQVPFL
jgi:hypothetical protein